MGRFVWVVQPIGNGPGEGDRHVEWWIVVTAADRTAGGLIIVVEAARAISYYLNTILASHKFHPPRLMPNNHAGTLRTSLTLIPINLKACHP